MVCFVFFFFWLAMNWIQIEKIVLNDVKTMVFWDDWWDILWEFSLPISFFLVGGVILLIDSELDTEIEFVDWDETSEKQWMSKIDLISNNLIIEKTYKISGGSVYYLMTIGNWSLFLWLWESYINSRQRIWSEMAENKKLVFCQVLTIIRTSPNIRRSLYYLTTTGNWSLTLWLLKLTLILVNPCDTKWRK